MDVGHPLGDGCSVTASSAEIDDFVESCSTSLAYHRSDFLELLELESGARAQWIVARDGRAITAVMPIMILDGPIGIVVNSLPFFGSNGGVIARQNGVASTKLVLRGFNTLCRHLDAISSTVITNPFVDNLEVYTDTLEWSHSDSRISQITRLSPCSSLEQLSLRFSNPRPRNIRKAQNSGIEVEISDSIEDLLTLASIHSSNMRAIGGKAKSEAFLHQLFTALSPGAWRLYTGRKDGVMVAGLLLLTHSQTVEYFIPGVIEEFRSTQANSLLIAQAMLELGNLGFRNWNWGGTWRTQAGVLAFKRKWGCDETLYHYYTNVRSNDLVLADRDALLKDYHGFYLYPFVDEER